LIRNKIIFVNIDFRFYRVVIDGWTFLFINLIALPEKKVKQPNKNNTAELIEK
jgi:hypothetical protein